MSNNGETFEPQMYKLMNFPLSKRGDRIEFKPLWDLRTGAQVTEDLKNMTTTPKDNFVKKLSGPEFIEVSKEMPDYVDRLRELKESEVVILEQLEKVRTVIREVEADRDEKIIQLENYIKCLKAR